MDADFVVTRVTLRFVVKKDTKNTRRKRTEESEIAIDVPGTNSTARNKSKKINEETKAKTLRPLLTGCTTYRMYVIKWFIPCKTVRFVP